MQLNFRITYSRSESVIPVSSLRLWRTIQEHLPLRLESYLHVSRSSLETASITILFLGVLLGVCDCQGPCPSVGNDGVRNRSSSFDITASGSSGTKPAPRKPPCTLQFVIASSKARLKHGRNSRLVIWVIWLCIRSSAWRPYAFSNGTKQLTSYGSSR
jgi:hypothetical protein